MNISLKIFHSILEPKKAHKSNKNISKYQENIMKPRFYFLNHNKIKKTKITWLSLYEDDVMHSETGQKNTVKKLLYKSKQVSLWKCRPPITQDLSLTSCIFWNKIHSSTATKKEDIFGYGNPKFEYLEKNRSFGQLEFYWTCKIYDLQICANASSNTPY